MLLHPLIILIIKQPGNEFREYRCLDEREFHDKFYVISVYTSMTYVCPESQEPKLPRSGLGANPRIADMCRNTQLRPEGFLSLLSFAFTFWVVDHERLRERSAPKRVRTPSMQL